MKRMYLSSNEMDTILKTAIETPEYIDSVEGALLDSFIVSVNGVTYACYEHYLNCWSSDYETYVATNEKECSDLLDDFVLYRQKIEEGYEYD